MHYPVPPRRPISIELRGSRELANAFRLIRQLDLIVVNYDVIGPTKPSDEEVAVGKLTTDPGVDAGARGAPEARRRGR